MNDGVNRAAQEDSFYKSLSYEKDIPIRGMEFNLPQIKDFYRALQEISTREGNNILRRLSKMENETDKQFEERYKNVRDTAFVLTITIAGYSSEQLYSESEKIFDSDHVNFQVKTIFFTNSSAFQRHANGRHPDNRFKIWLNFDKPDILDPNPLVSHPTDNSSHVELSAQDPVFFNAVENIISTKILKKRLWYSFLNEKFAYDVGFWFFALPYALLMSSYISHKVIVYDVSFDYLRIPIWIYVAGFILMGYRSLMGYAKWAFPVNVLEENRDKSAKHRYAFYAVIAGAFGSVIKAIPPSVAKYLLPW